MEGFPGVVERVDPPVIPSVFTHDVDTVMKFLVEAQENTLKLQRETEQVLFREASFTGTVAGAVRVQAWQFYIDFTILKSKVPTGRVEGGMDVYREQYAPLAIVLPYNGSDPASLFIRRGDHFQMVYERPGHWRVRFNYTPSLPTKIVYPK